MRFRKECQLASLGMDGIRRISSVNKMDDYSAELQYYRREKGSLMASKSLQDREHEVGLSQLLTLRRPRET